jgi:hypothetical protein
MAQCAKIDINNTVTQLVTVDDSIQDKEKYCFDLFGGVWKEYSLDNSFRGNPASIGGKYDSENDVFLFSKPYNSWTLDENLIWNPPVAIPTNNLDYKLIWDEENLRWKGLDKENNQFYWNPDSSSWISM